MDEVLTAATRVFIEKGYEATSMQDLVDAMGISRASLYDTFGDKETLFLKVLDRYDDWPLTRRVGFHVYPRGSIAPSTGFVPGSIGLSNRAQSPGIRVV